MISQTSSTLSIAIVTVSDRAARGVYPDGSGPAVRELCRDLFRNRDLHFEERIVPDDSTELKRMLRECIDNNVDYLFTTGGTGIGPRDITPEVTREVLQKELPGIGEAMRHMSMEITPHAMLSRATAGIAGTTLIVNLPGSPKAVREILPTLGPALEHAFFMLHGIDTHAQIPSR